ncbi:Peptide deformylase [subsurface metagenome]
MEIVTDIKKLRKPTEWVKQSDLVLEVAAALFEGMREHDAVGMSANQLGYDLRMFVMELRQHTQICIVNPVMTRTKGSYERQEGCLSLPGIVIHVKRPMEVRVKGVNQYFKPVNYKFTGIEARQACHEIDHLIGKLITDYMEEVKR